MFQDAALQSLSAASQWAIFPSRDPPQRPSETPPNGSRPGRNPPRKPPREQPYSRDSIGLRRKGSSQEEGCALQFAVIGETIGAKRGGLRGVQDALYL